MKKLQSHSIALLFSCLIVVSSLGVIQLARFIDTKSDDTVHVRTIETLALSPPPPPPPVQSNPIETPEISISATGSGPAIEMSLTPPKVELNTQPVELNFKQESINWDDSLTVDWDAFSLEQLDNIPALLSSTSIKLHKKIARNKTQPIKIKLDVIIDEHGKVNLLNIVENPYPSLIKEIKRFANKARFQAPTKQGESVRARFIWPIEI